MAMSNLAKLGISAGLGASTTLVTDAALRYWAPIAPKEVTSAADLANPDKWNWYYRYSSLLGGLAAVGVGIVLGYTWGTEEGLAAGIAGVGVALSSPIRELVDTARAKASAPAGLRQIAAMRALARNRPVAVSRAA